MIEGVLIHPLKQLFDFRGKVMHMSRRILMPERFEKGESMK